MLAIASSAKVGAVSGPVAFTAAVLFVCPPLDGATRKKAVGLHVMLMTSVVAAFVTLRRVRHLTNDSIFVLLRMIRAVAFAYELADEYADFFVNWNENSIVFAFSAFGSFSHCNPSPPVAVFAHELAIFHLLSDRNDLSVLVAAAA